jgi:fucose 4-O-acetylase-like acetyltransferase
LSYEAARADLKKISDKNLSRTEWIDVARGIGIILVVYGHVLRGLLGAGVFSSSNPLFSSDYAIYTFHMPLFFLLAGLHVDHSMAKGGDRFLLSKLRTIAYPYMLWSTIQGTVQLIFPSYLNSSRSLASLGTILWRPFGQFWFLYVLFVCHIFALLFSRQRRLLAGVALFAYCLSMYIKNPFWNPILYMLPFYIVGIFLGRHVNHWRPNLKSIFISGSFCAFLLTFAIHFGRTASGGVVSSFFSLPAAVSGIALICILSQLIVCANKRLSSVLTVIGLMSMTIYILHVMAASGVRIALIHAGVRDWAEQLVIGVIAGVGLPMIAHAIFQRLGLLGVLGLGSSDLQNVGPTSKNKHVYVR